MRTRAAVAMEAGKPLEVIEDPIEQGFMSGDQWEAEDLDKTGPIVQHNDFAEWKVFR